MCEGCDEAPCSYELIAMSRLIVDLQRLREPRDAVSRRCSSQMIAEAASQGVS